MHKDAKPLNYKPEDHGEEVFWQENRGSEPNALAFSNNPALSLINDEREEMLEKLLLGEVFEESERQALASVLLMDAKDFQEVFEKVEAKIGQNEKSQKVREVIETLSEPDRGDNRLGAAMGWWIEEKDGLNTSLPFIYHLNKDGFAAKNGLGKQDIIQACQGLPLYSTESRNNFMRLVRLWPKNLALDLNIQREEYVGTLRKRIKGIQEPASLILP